MDIEQYLISSGANINAINKEGFTPLHFAACEGRHLFILFFSYIILGWQALKSTVPVRLLLRAGAVPKIKDLLGTALL